MYTYGDVYDFFVYLINNFISSDINSIQFIGQLFEKSKNPRINSITILNKLFNAQIPEDFKGKDYGKILKSIDIPSNPSLPSELQLSVFLVGCNLQIFRQIITKNIVLPTILETPTISSTGPQGQTLYNKLQLNVTNDKYSIISIAVTDDGKVIAPSQPIIFNLRSQKPENPALVLCQQFVGVSVDDPTFTKEIYFKILSVTGRPWRFCDCWGTPSHIKATGNPSYPYAWVAKPGSAEAECAAMFGSTSGAGIKKKSYKKKNKKVLNSKKHYKR